MKGANTPRGSYWSQSRLPWPMLLALLPLVLLDEWGLLFHGANDRGAWNRAQDQLIQFLSIFDLPPSLVLPACGIIIIVVLLTWHLLSNDSWRVRPLVPVVIPCEGAILSIPLVVMSLLLAMGMTLAGSSTPTDFSSLPFIDSLLVSTAAGLYEELLFRMICIALLHTLLVNIFRLAETWGIALAVIGSTIAFAWYHDPSLASPGEIAFLLMAGLYLGAVYVSRGFAVVVWTHVIYDVIVLTLFMQD